MCLIPRLDPQKVVRPVDQDQSQVLQHLLEVLLATTNKPESSTRLSMGELHKE